MKKVSGVINVVIITLIAVICFKNSGNIQVDFIFASPTMPLFAFLLIAFALGMIFGRTLFSMLTKKQKK
ncbi:lipopolysaccharide assembly protein LapA domain-containing protein [Candidatus Uabimicrobium sp. HlEnr_7]|uniref:lipopolysaccharide assembly protein LapA domain-containing protein n=1 Tax=Candidatus Uabimicrobium helgolandensis TaxID=3095367 RepID=UPI00355884A1